MKMLIIMRYRKLNISLKRFLKDEGIYTFVDGNEFHVTTWELTDGSKMKMLYHVDGKLGQLWKELPTFPVEWGWLSPLDYYENKWPDHSNMGYSWADCWALSNDLFYNLRWKNSDKVEYSNVLNA